LVALRSPAKPVMGPGQIFLTQVGSFFVAWVGFDQPPLGLENFPFSVRNDIGLGPKIPTSKTDQPLIYHGSKVCSGLGPSLC